MRPEIARLLTPHIYQDLENHPSVLKYEQIKVSLSYLVVSDGVSSQGGFLSLGGKKAFESSSRGAREMAQCLCTEAVVVVHTFNPSPRGQRHVDL